MTISTAALQSIPTFGGPATSAPVSLANVILVPIPSICPTSATSPSYQQELPSKLVCKILDLEFIEMAELVPDSWRWITSAAAATTPVFPGKVR